MVVRIVPNRNAILLASIYLVSILYYTFVLTGLRFDAAALFAPVAHGLTFNSMLDHLLHGEFDVDPSTIGEEAFVRGGRYFTYFGIFPAFLRLVVSPFVDLRNTDVTVLSCVFATIISAGCYFGCIVTTIRYLPQTRAGMPITAIGCLTVLLSGSQIQFLKPSIYQEVVSWSGALAAAFILTFFRALVRGRMETAGTLALLAILSGCCLLTRFSLGLGLCSASILIFSVIIFARLRNGGLRFPLILGIGCAGGLLVCFILIAGGVNYGRWGSVTTFIPLELNLGYASSPERLARRMLYGDWNFQRILYGIMYYFLPLWAIRRPDGHFLFYQFRERAIDGVEAPPSTFLLTDFLILSSALYWICTRFRERRALALEDGLITAAAIALAIPPVIVLGASYMAFRYRMEFYPLFYALGLCGMREALRGMRTMDPSHSRRLTIFVCTGAAVSIIASHVSLFLYLSSHFDNPALAEKSGWIKYFSVEDQLAKFLQRVEAPFR